MLVVLVPITPLITALMNASWPTFSLCLAFTISILRFSSSILLRLCSSLSWTLCTWVAMASEKYTPYNFAELIFYRLNGKSEVFRCLQFLLSIKMSMSVQNLT